MDQAWSLDMEYIPSVTGKADVMTYGMFKRLAAL